MNEICRLLYTLTYSEYHKHRSLYDRLKYAEAHDIEILEIHKFVKEYIIKYEKTH